MLLTSEMFVLFSDLNITKSLSLSVRKILMYQIVSYEMIKYPNVSGKYFIAANSCGGNVMISLLACFGHLIFIAKWKPGTQTSSWWACVTSLVTCVHPVSLRALSTQFTVLIVPGQFLIICPHSQMLELTPLNLMLKQFSANVPWLMPSGGSGAQSPVTGREKKISIFQEYQRKHLMCDNIRCYIRMSPDSDQFCRHVTSFNAHIVTTGPMNSPWWKLDSHTSLHGCIHIQNLHHVIFHTFSGF